MCELFEEVSDLIVGLACGAQGTKTGDQLLWQRAARLAHG
jgi:hypothetical protein